MKVTQLKFTDLTRAGKADCASINVVGTRVHAAIIDGGRVMESCHSAPDSHNPFRHLISRAIHHAGGRSDSDCGTASFPSDIPPATNHQHAEIVRTDSKDHPCHERQSAPSYPAPNSNDQHADGAAHVFLHHRREGFPSKHQSYIGTCPSAPLSNENTGESRLRVSSQSPRPTRSPLVKRSRLSNLWAYIWSHSAYSDPSKVRTNFGWSRRDGL